MKYACWIAIALCVVSPVRADVVAVGPSGFEIRNEAVVNAAPGQVWTGLVRRVGRWWDPEHTYSGDARNMRIDARPGGCFCEKIPGKGAIEHMRVIYVSQDQVLRLSGGLGPLQESGVTGTLTWTLKAEGQGTRIVQDYRVGGFRADGFEALAPLVMQVLDTQLQRLKGHVETGKPQEK